MSCGFLRFPKEVQAAGSSIISSSSCLARAQSAEHEQPSHTRGLESQLKTMGCSRGVLRASRKQVVVLPVQRAGRAAGGAHTFLGDSRPQRAMRRVVVFGRLCTNHMLLEGGMG